MWYCLAFAGGMILGWCICALFCVKDIQRPTTVVTVNKAPLDREIRAAVVRELNRLGTDPGFGKIRGR